MLSRIYTSYSICNELNTELSKTLNRRSLFIWMLLLCSCTLQAQIRLYDYQWKTVKDSLFLRVSIQNKGADTALFLQHMVLHQSKPLLLVQDTVQLTAHSRQHLLFLIDSSILLDKEFHRYLRISGGPPAEKLQVYSNLRENEAEPLSFPDRGSMRSRHTLQKTDSGYLLHIVPEDMHHFRESDSVHLFLQVPDMHKKGKWTEVLLGTFPVQAGDTISSFIPSHVGIPDQPSRILVKCAGFQLFRTKPIPPQELKKIRKIPIKPPREPSFNQLQTTLDQFIPPDINKDLYRTPLISGGIRNESRYQNFIYPNSLMIPSYSRTYLDASLAIPLFPVKLNGLLTTERYGGRNLSFFRADFDRAGFQSRRVQSEAFLKNQLVQQRFQLEEKRRNLNNKLFQSVKSLEQQSLSDSLLKEQLNRLSDELQKHVRDSMNRLDSLISLQDSLPDSLKYTDTLNYDELRHQRDSLQQEWEKLEKTRDSLQQVYEKAMAMKEQAEATVSRLKGLREKLNDSEKLLNRLEDKYRKLYEQPSFLDKIDQFSLGQIAVRLNPLSTDGLMVRGISTNLNHQGYRLRLVYGKANNDQGDSLQNPAYRMPVYGFAVSSPEQHDFSSEISVVHFDNRQQLTLSKPLTSNTLAGWLFIWKAPYRIVLKNNVVYGINRYTPFTGENRDSAGMQSGGTALHSEMNWLSVDGHSEVSVRYKRLGADFYSAGNPFLRTNYQESEMAWQQKWTRLKLKSKVLYRLSTDNLDESKQFRTTMQGAGVTVNSEFRKWPNFIASYMPFETVSKFQPTRFADPNQLHWLSQYQNRTKTSVLLLNVFHNFSWKTWLFQWNASFTGSRSELNNQTTRVNNTSLLLSGEGEKLKISGRYQNFSLLPSQSDTSKINSFELSGIYTLSNRWEFQGAYSYSVQGNSRISDYVILGLGTNWKGFLIQAGYQIYRRYDLLNLEGTQRPMAINVQLQRRF